MGDDADRVTKPLTQPIREEGTAPTAEMPRYTSHKEVQALKIAAIEFDVDKARAEGRETDATAIITPAEPGYAPFKVSAIYVHKHAPRAGGYYVVYRDGYQSFSPSEAFEEGYTRIAP